jgi:hypothetical protein
MHELDVAQRTHLQIDLDFKECERQMEVLFPKGMLNVGDKSTEQVVRTDGKSEAVDRKPRKKFPLGYAGRSVTPPKGCAGLLFPKLAPLGVPKPKGQTAPVVIGIRKKFSLRESQNEDQAREPEVKRGKARSVPGCVKPLLLG